MKSDRLKPLKDVAGRPLPIGGFHADSHRRLSSGRRVSEVMCAAARWWDGTGRHIVRNPEWGDPDVGFASGITRGLAWDELDGRERIRVVAAYHEHQVVAKGAPA